MTQVKFVKKKKTAKSEIHENYEIQDEKYRVELIAY